MLSNVHSRALAELAPTGPLLSRSHHAAPCSTLPAGGVTDGATAWGPVRRLEETGQRQPQGPVGSFDPAFRVPSLFGL